MNKYYFNIDFFQKVSIHRIFLTTIIILSFVFRGFVASSDAASSWFSPWYNITQIFYVWNTYTTPGSYSPNSFTSFFLRLFYSFFELFSDSPAFIQKMVWIVFFVVVGNIIYTIIKRQFNIDKNFSVLLVLFIIFNPISLFYSWGKQHWAYYLPPIYFITYAYYLKYLETKQIRFLYTISFIWLFFAFALNQPAYFVPWGFLIFTTFIWYIFTEKKYFSKILLFKDNILFGLSFFLINALYILPLLLFGNSQLENAQKAYASNDPIPILHDLTSVNLFHSMFDFTVGYTNTFGSDIVTYTLWVAFILTLFYVLLFKIKDNNEKKITSFIFLVLVFLIFLNKGLAEPFSEISEKIFSFKLMYIFRDFRDKFAILYSLIISSLTIYALNKSKFFNILFVIVVCLSCYLFISNSWTPKNFTFSDDLSYLKELKFEDKPTSRILSLPLVEYSFFYTSDPIYTGDSPLKNIFHKEVVFTSAQKENDYLKVKDMFSENKLDSVFFESFLKENNIQYILSNLNSYVREDGNKFYYDPTTLDKLSYLTLVKSDNRYKLYEFKSFLPRIYGSNIFFKKESLVSYRVHVTNLNKESLWLLDAYHPGWNAYIVPVSHFNWCEQYVEYQNNVKECINNTGKNFLNDNLNLLHSIIKNYVFSDHSDSTIGFDVAKDVNTWDLDERYVENNFDNKYYVENEDGTIDIDLYIYFKPQIYFYLGLIISIISISFYLIKIFNYSAMES